MTPAQATQATRMSEDDLLVSVIELAERLGWAVMHPRPCRRKGRDGEDKWETAVQGTYAKGYPDLTMAHPGKGRFLMAELKSVKGRQSPDQLAWMVALRAARVDFHLWRPADWVSGRIEAALR